MTFESSDKLIQNHITFNNDYWTLVVLVARKLLVSGTSNVSSVGCRFFASRFLRLKNESRRYGREKPIEASDFTSRIQKNNISISFGAARRT